MVHSEISPRISALFCVATMLAMASACSPTIVEEDDSTLLATAENLREVVASDAFLADPAAFLMTESAEALVANPETRAMLREEVHEHATNPDVEIRVPRGATRLTVQVLITGPDDSPLEAALVDLVQTDVSGFYHEVDGAFNPWLFTTARTDDEGRASLRTFVPGNYADENGELVPRHIHFTATHEDRNRAAEFLFDVDPDFDSQLAAEEALPVARCEIEEEGGWFCSVTIQL